MTESRNVVQFERRNSGWIKPAVVALCMIAAGLGAITVAEVAATRPHPSAVSAAPATAHGAADSPTSLEAAVSLRDENDDAASGFRKRGDAGSLPRECQPYEGVNFECTFN